MTASGELIHVTADNEHSDLFFCLPWSHGTLGFLVALELQLIRIKPFVHLEYIPVCFEQKKARNEWIGGPLTNGVLREDDGVVGREGQGLQDARLSRSHDLQPRERGDHGRQFRGSGHEGEAEKGE